jgi:hypothetical protein
MENFGEDGKAAFSSLEYQVLMSGLSLEDIASTAEEFGKDRSSYILAQYRDIARKSIIVLGRFNFLTNKTLFHVDIKPLVQILSRPVTAERKHIRTKDRQVIFECLLQLFHVLTAVQIRISQSQSLQSPHNSPQITKRVDELSDMLHNLKVAGPVCNSDYRPGNDLSDQQEGSNDGTTSTTVIDCAHNAAVSATDVELPRNDVSDNSNAKLLPKVDCNDVATSSTAIGSSQNEVAAALAQTVFDHTTLNIFMQYDGHLNTDVAGVLQESGADAWGIRVVNGKFTVFAEGTISRVEFLEAVSSRHRELAPHVIYERRATSIHFDSGLKIGGRFDTATLTHISPFLPKRETNISDNSFRNIIHLEEFV